MRKRKYTFWQAVMILLALGGFIAALSQGQWLLAIVLLICAYLLA